MSDLDWQCFWFFEMWEMYDGGSDAKFQQNITNPPPPPPPRFRKYPYRPGFLDLPRHSSVFSKDNENVGIKTMESPSSITGRCCRPYITLLLIELKN